jgi:hypothetical protein
MTQDISHTGWVGFCANGKYYWDQSGKDTVPEMLTSADRWLSEAGGEKRVTALVYEYRTETQRNFVTNFPAVLAEIFKAAGFESTIDWRKNRPILIPILNQIACKSGFEADMPDSKHPILVLKPSATLG